MENLDKKRPAFARFVAGRPRLAITVAIVVIALLVFGWIAWTDFGNYQLELRDASQNALAVPNGKNIREIDVQEHIAGFTYGILLFATFSFVVSFGALVFLGWTLRETREMAIETRNMVSQTARDADEARLLSHAQYRAYVRAEEACLGWRNGRWELRVKYQNDGQSPALFIHHRAEVRIRHDAWPRPADIPFGGKGIYDPKRPLPPSDSDYYSYPVPDYGKASASPGKWVTFIGDIIYRDIFGRWLRTEFEFYLTDMMEVAWLAKTNPLKLEWGRRGPGGVYEFVDVPNEPDDVRALIARLEGAAASRELASETPS